MDGKLKVAEYMGPHGTVNVPVEFIHYIWQEGFFNSDALRLADGRKIFILDCGDKDPQNFSVFREAKFKLDEKEICGKVSVHIYPNDCLDFNFQDIILQVAVFPEVNLQRKSDKLPLLILLPYLEDSLDETIEDYGIRALAKGLEDPLSLELNASLIQDCSRTRWIQKCENCSQKIDSVGWKTSFHQLILEALGARKNKESMSAISHQFTLDDLQKNEFWDAEFLFKSQKTWRLRGVLPPAHPKKRLDAYLRLIRSKDVNFEESLKDLFLKNLPTEGDTSSFRKEVRLKKLQEHLKHQVFANVFSENLLNTVVCDVLLPMIASQMEREQLYAYWFHWFPGNCPKEVKLYARLEDQVLSNGLIQGILQLFILNARNG